jgi:hypothetical protein
MYIQGYDIQCIFYYRSLLNIRKIKGLPSPFASWKNSKSEFLGSDFIILFIYLQNWGWTQGLMLARQALYQLSHSIWAVIFFFFEVLGFELRAYTLSHSTSPFLWWVSFEIGSCGSICPGWLRTMILLISDSWVVRITGVSHQHQHGQWFLKNISWAGGLAEMVELLPSESSTLSANPSTNKKENEQSF